MQLRFPSRKRDADKMEKIKEASIWFTNGFKYIIFKRNAKSSISLYSDVGGSAVT